MTTSLIVVDASFTFRLILPGPQQTQYQKLMTRWKQQGQSLYTTTLWIYEITSALTKAIHFARLTETEGLKALQLARKLNLQMISPDEEQIQLAVDWTKQLDRAAAYNSFYLALAESLSADFWTADKRLFNAVDKPWIYCI